MTLVAYLSTELTIPVANFVDTSVVDVGGKFGINDGAGGKLTTGVNSRM